MRKRLIAFLTAISMAFTVANMPVTASAESGYDTDAGRELTSIAINDTNFPDENFRTWVNDNVDLDNNSFLSDEEIAKVTSVDVTGQGIADLKGIEYFAELTTLICSDNQLDTLDVSNNTALEILDCSNNHLSSLDLTGTAVSEYGNFTCTGNVYSVSACVLDLKTRKGFECNQVSNVNGMKLDGSNFIYL